MAGQRRGTAARSCLSLGPPRPRGRFGWCSGGCDTARGRAMDGPVGRRKSARSRHPARAAGQHAGVGRSRGIKHRGSGRSREPARPVGQRPARYGRPGYGSSRPVWPYGAGIDGAVGPIGPESRPGGECPRRTCAGGSWGGPVWRGLFDRSGSVGQGPDGGRNPREKPAADPLSRGHARQFVPPDASGFLSFIASAEAEAIFARYGFTRLAER